jgi:hypothetical protein
LKNFIELTNLDVDVVDDGKVVELIKNEASADEENIVIEIERDEGDNKSGSKKVVGVDDSEEAIVEDSESEAESEENNVIFNNDEEKW